MRFNMNLKTVLLLLGVSATVLGNAEKEKRQTTSLDWSSILSQVSVLTEKFPAGTTTVTIPFVTPGGNLLQPPASIVPMIITAVPASILVDLVNPSARSSIASEFASGNTPQWYATLPSPLKSYIEALNSQIRAGQVDLSATPSAFQFPVTTTSTGKATGKGDTVATSTSKAIAAQVTGGVGMSVAAAVGILGLAIAL